MAAVIPSGGLRAGKGAVEESALPPDAEVQIPRLRTRSAGAPLGMTGAVASFTTVLAELAEAERREGWLARCAEAGRYLVLTAELVEVLAEELLRLGDGPVLEVCAGDGRLAEILREWGVEVIATDAAPPSTAGSIVSPLAAAEAVAIHRPHIVLGSFVPVDAGVDRAVLACPEVQHYLVLNARFGGVFGSADLWNTPGWLARPLERVTRGMVTRHDVWLAPGVPPRRKGEAWLFSRRPAGR